MLEVNNKIGKVFLIGAGPGDPGLLTIKAACAIATADVVVYDYLVNPQVLAHSRPGAELIYAGKRAGEHSMSQEEINRLLISRDGFIKFPCVKEFVALFVVIFRIKRRRRRRAAGISIPI